MVARRIGDFLKAVRDYVDGKQGLVWVSMKLGVKSDTLQAILLEADLIDINDRPKGGVTGQDIVNAIILYYLRQDLVKSRSS